MKLSFVVEDCLVAIACGLLLIGFTGRYFSLQLPGLVYVIALVILILFILFDIFNEIKEIGTQFGFMFFSILHNIIDLGISLAYISHFGKFEIPYATSYLLPYLQGEAAMFLS